MKTLKAGIGLVLVLLSFVGCGLLPKGFDWSASQEDEPTAADEAIIQQYLSPSRVDIKCIGCQDERADELAFWLDRHLRTTYRCRLLRFNLKKVDITIEDGTNQISVELLFFVPEGRFERVEAERFIYNLKEYPSLEKLAKDTICPAILL